MLKEMYGSELRELIEGFTGSLISIRSDRLHFS